MQLSMKAAKEIERDNSFSAYLHRGYDPVYHITYK
jgi:hypothetical protein